MQLKIQCMMKKEALALGTNNNVLVKSNNPNCPIRGTKNLIWGL